MKFRFSKPNLGGLIAYLIICISVAGIIFTSVNFYFGRNNNKNQLIENTNSKMPAIEVGREPELIKAYGIDGTIGYVLSTDLEGDKPKNPKEALELLARNKTSREIPLYDSSGKKVIGKFIVDP